MMMRMRMMTSLMTMKTVSLFAVSVDVDEGMFW